MRLSPTVMLASVNRGKFEEFKALLSAYAQIELVPAAQLLRNPGKLQFVEHYETYRENAVAKARVANQASHYPSLADDSGLEVEFLDGKPGPRSHRYATPQAHLTQDEANVAKLLAEMKGAKSRSARFVCHLSLVIEGVLLHAEGTLEGTLAEAPRGTHGFGYDPIFIPKGETRTLAEMTDEEKNKISHRAVALRHLMEQVKAYGIVFDKP